MDVLASAALVRFVATARHATLATVDPSGHPRLVPICFVLGEPSDQHRPAGEVERLVLYTAIDEKPKRSDDPMRLARVRDLLARPTATLLVDRWDEDWQRLAWARLDCRAEILGPADSPAERGRAIGALRGKYPQYRTHRLESRPLVRLTCKVGAAWGDLTADLTEENV